MNLIEYLELEIKNKLLELGYEDDVKLEVSNRPDLGDYQYNGAFLLAKKHGKNPVEIAGNLVSLLEKERYFKKVTAAGPFINLTLSEDALVEYINKLKEDSNLNIPKYDKKTVLFDYGGANIAKELHVGHLRSANIGEALKRLFNLVGYHTISDVHLGDWGRPMGLIINEIKTMYPDLAYFNKDYNKTTSVEFPIKDSKELNELYPRASLKAKDDETYLEEARKITTELQNGHLGYLALWQDFYDLSVNDIKDIYSKLNATFDLWEGESDADKYIPEMMEYLTSNNLTEKSDGAVVINIKQPEDKREMPPLILIKSDGGVLYDTTELATIYYRVKKYNPNYLIYLTDIRQELHFISAFRAAYKTKIVSEDTTLEHLCFGTVNGEGGKPFKTRDGGVLSLKELIRMVTVETRKQIKDNIKEEHKDELAEKLAIAAIKYADLLPNPSSDYVFDPVKFSDLNGKTGLYLLYSTVRMKSLLKKCFDANIKIGSYDIISTEEEREIILILLELKNVLMRSVKNRSLNEIAEYLYSLTSSFNTFYSKHEIINHDNLETQVNWVTLTSIALETNLLLLDVLAIDVPDEI